MAKAGHILMELLYMMADSHPLLRRLLTKTYKKPRLTNVNPQARHSIRLVLAPQASLQPPRRKTRVVYKGRTKTVDDAAIRVAIAGNGRDEGTVIPSGR